MKFTSKFERRFNIQFFLPLMPFATPTYNYLAEIMIIYNNELTTVLESDK
jgi:predicted subunit of tRNA(5-methylaminomethyl-2-thiouridylate) methyltransferase